ncbi:MAG: ferritin family protein [Rhizomicrobium sp.]
MVASDTKQETVSGTTLQAVAAALEAAALRRYQRLAAWWAAEGEAELAALFTRLAEMEASHAAAFGPIAKETGSPPPAVGEEEALWQSALLTPYRALSLAVRAEERAFATYADLAAHAATPALRGQAENLAREELEHAAILRRARRAAFHSERPFATPLPADMVALEQQGSFWEAEVEAAKTRAGRLRALSRNAERYLAVAERARDEATLGAAQNRAQATLRTLARLRVGTD